MINIYAPISNLGYGVHSNNMIKAFIDLNTDINLTPIGQIQNDPYFESYWQKSINNLQQFNAKNPSLFIFHDHLSHQSCGSPLFVFSIFETDRPKKESIKMLKDGPCDIVLTTTQEHKIILEGLDIGKEIRVLNEGIDDTIFNTIPVDKHIDTKKFTFITVGKNEERKKTTDIIRAYIETMKDNDVALIAHTFNPFVNREKCHPFENLATWCNINPVNYGFEYKGWNNKAHVFSHKQCDIYFTAPTIQTAEMGCLYHSANVGIQCSRGEGWDLPLGEMFGCGLPVIATDCLGHNEYLNKIEDLDQNLLITKDSKEPAIDNIWFNGDQGNWSIVSYFEIKDKISYAYENRNKFEQKNEKIASSMANNFPWVKAATEFKNMC